MMKRVGEFFAIGLFTLLFCPLSWGQITITDTVLDPNGSIRAYQELQIEVEHFKSHLREAPELFSQEEGIQIRLPSPDEGWLTFELYKAPIMAAGMAKRYPQVKNYKGRDVERPERQIRLNIGPRGMFAVVSGPRGKYYIHPPGFSGGVHKLYRARDTYSNWSCDLDESQLQESRGTPSEQESQNNCTVLGADLMTYRIVVATTGEFYELNETGGGMPEVVQALTDRLADMLIPYERDLSMTFTLVDSNDIVMYDDPATDPFPNPTNTGESINDAEATIEANFDDADYDIGHGYHEITCGGSCGWGGLAGLAVACRDGNKARGYTFQPNDISTNTVFSHEFGHQLSCYHTNYGCNSDGCHRFEPGQGITIMSTSANCGSEDFVAPRVDFFHARSIEAILEYTLNGLFNDEPSCDQVSMPGWSKCVQESSSGNQPPTVDADPNMKNYTIPVETPFYLEGSVSDPDGDPWTANWVDFNSDPTQTSPPDQAHDISTAPLFRWYEPDGDVGRYFPKYSTILSGNFVSGQGEVLPSVGRTMDFRLIARDNAMPYGALACDEITVTVDGNSGPFQVTSPNTGIVWEAGETETVTWAVNNTDQAPINAAEVDILLSTDGGATFPTTLASNVANDGSHPITVPSSATNTARVRIQPSASEYIFFDISDVDFVINDGGCDAVSYQVHPDDPVQAEEGDPALDMEMYLGSVITSIVDTTTSNDPATNLATEDQGGGCIFFGNMPYHKMYELLFTENGSYTFNRNSANGFLIFNLYLDTFDLTSVCTNFLASNAEHTGGGSISISSSYSISLSTDTTYELAVNGFNDGQERAFDISFSGPGNVLLEADGPVGYLSEFVIVEDGGGTIESIVNQPDMSSFAPGNYTIHGLHYLSSEDLSGYVGGAFSSLESDLMDGTVCGALSSNTRSVEVQQVLPLEFLFFQVEKKGENALLEWRVAESEKVSHFDIQKWSDKFEAFTHLDEQNFQGNGTYTYPDIQPGPGLHIYRIESIDRDGLVTQSPIRSVNFATASERWIYPNPNRGQFRISREVDQMKVFNALGTVVDERSNLVANERIELGFLPSGKYLVQFKSAGEETTTELLIITD